jgi:2'-5' RNA ligase
MKIRSFIAINLSPGQLTDGISAALASLKSGGAAVKWVRAENLHLTIKFLGGVDEGLLLGEIGESLKAAALRRGSFKLTFKGVGCFPDVRRPRVVWVGVDAPDEFFGLHADIEAAMEALGFKREGREFSPHLTLGRVRAEVRPAARGGASAGGKFVTRSGGDFGELGRAIAGLSERVFGSLDVESFALMRSDLSPMRSDLSPMRSDLSPLRSDLSPLKSDLSPLKSDLSPGGPKYTRVMDFPLAGVY